MVESGARNKELSITQENFLSHFVKEGGFSAKGYYEWKLHEQHPDLPLAPFYSNLRILQRYPYTKRLAVELYKEQVLKRSFDLLAPVPQAATVLVSSIADKLQIPMVTPRLDKKNHGKKDRVEGLENTDRGRTVLLIDDVATTGDSKLEVISLLEKEGVVVNDVLVAIDYEIVAYEDLGSKGYALHTIFTLDQMLNFYLKEGKLDRDKRDEILRWRDEAREIIKSPKLQHV